MALTDEELMLLENLEYLDKNMEKEFGLSINNSDRSSVAGLVNSFDEKTLQEMDKKTDGFMSGREMAAIIRQIKNNPNLMDLKVVNKNNLVYSTCYTDSEGNAYVTFKGTADGREWYDDAEGLLEADTPCQKEALDYIESLPYDDITVTGHSKGGNKAQYVTITSKKVKRCVSMDGQGFSQEFLDKYSAEINAKGHLIRNYSLSTDYVHILLFKVPGASQIYLQGDEALAWERNHSPTAFYQYYYDENGDYQIVVNAEGQTNLIWTEENKCMQYLFKFTCYVLEVMPDEKKSEIIEFLGNLLALARTNDFTIKKEDGTVYGHDDLMLYLLSEPDRAALAIAYFIKYIKLEGLEDEEISDLLVAFGLKDDFDQMMEAIKNDPKVSFLAFLASAVVNLMDEDLESEEVSIAVDLILSAIYKFYLEKMLHEKFGENASIDLNELWRTIKKEYKMIPNVDINKIEITKLRITGKTLDYSRNAYDTIMNTIDNVERLTFESVSAWRSYSNNSWYNDFGISIFISGLYNYSDFLTDINTNCKSQINSIFDNIGGIDSRKAKAISRITQNIDHNTIKMQAISNRLS